RKKARAGASASGLLWSDRAGGHKQDRHVPRARVGLAARVVAACIQAAWRAFNAFRVSKVWIPAGKWGGSCWCPVADSFLRARRRRATPMQRVELVCGTRVPDLRVHAGIARPEAQICDLH